MDKFLFSAGGRILIFDQTQVLGISQDEKGYMVTVIEDGDERQLRFEDVVITRGPETAFITNPDLIRDAAKGIRNPNGPWLMFEDDPDYPETIKVVDDAVYFQDLVDDGYLYIELSKTDLRQIARFGKGPQTLSGK
jgi:hypothetical protein